MVRAKDVPKQGSKRIRVELVDLQKALEGRKRNVIEKTKTKKEKVTKATAKIKKTLKAKNTKSKPSIVEEVQPVAIKAKKEKNTNTIKLSDSFKLNGSAESIEDEDTFILTRSEKDQVGSVWTQDRIENVGNGFECEFKFQITEVVNGGADGFAFVIQDSPKGNDSILKGGCDLGYCGMVNGFIAVEFDTYCNENIGDPKQQHVSIQSYGCMRNKKIYSNHKYSLGCYEFSKNINDGKERLVKVVYTPTGHLSIDVDNINVLNNIKLKQKLPKDAFLGFTSATGLYHQQHLIKECEITLKKGE